MDAQQQSNSTTRVLRLATTVEVVFLLVSAFFLFTEHRAHFLGALPYALLIVCVTVFLWFLAERRKHRADSGSGGKPRPGKGLQFHA